MSSWKYLSIIVLCACQAFCSITDKDAQFLSHLSTTKDSPLYTTYAAAMERAEFILDEGYHFLFYDSERGIDFTTDTAGDWCLAFKQDTGFVYKLKDIYQEPIITLSYPDMVRYMYYPLEGLCVEATFFVYSSHIALQDITLINAGKQKIEFQVIPFLKNNYRTFNGVKLHPEENAISFKHEELPDDWVLRHNIPYAEKVQDVFLLSREPAHMNINPEEITNILERDFTSDIPHHDQLKTDDKNLARVIALPIKIELSPGEREQFRIIRAVGSQDMARKKLISQAQNVLDIDIDNHIQKNEHMFGRIPRLKFDKKEKELLYWSAFNLMRQVMLPPEGKCGYNYYVFSREPTWGWGHGGQVFHESLTMMAYAFMDPKSAMNSQRIYLERQTPQGYINYRTGPYLDETIPFEGQLTSSAPWYAWQNWEIYKITRDKKFLKDMYDSSKAFYEYYVSNRDTDGDGLCEWGAHAVLESVRDSSVAVWDEVAWPSSFEAVDLNCMLVQEAKTLEEMALELGLDIEAKCWKKDAQSRQEKINALMWDEETGFYYHVDKKDHDFTYKNPDDLKRQEIIGFLPLWAGIASKSQAEKLIQKLTNPNKFWRKYGIPTLTADDPYYNPKGYWNGPVWVEWNYLILYGLIQYGYRGLAEELVERVATNMISQLKKDHQFWEFYSPDDQWAGYHKQYIWAGCINRMLIDTSR